MHWLDMIKFDPLVERLAQLDRELDRIEEAIASHEFDPLVLLEDAEAVIGEGFLLCQLYMIERKGDHPAKRAYACGPRLNAEYLAHVINMAGNYHKHRGEWPDDPAKWDHNQHRAVAVFRDAGVVEPEFWLSHLLARVSNSTPSRLAALVPILIEWRESFDRLGNVAATPST